LLNSLLLYYQFRELETENANLQEEYKYLHASSGSSGSGSAPNSSSSSTGLSSGAGHAVLGNGLVPQMSSEAEILHEAKMLREHKDRLESRMKVLEVHNNQLEMQLGKLKTLLHDPNAHSGPGGPGGLNNGTIMSNKTGTLNTKSVTASQLATNSPILPHRMNNGSNAPAPPGEAKKNGGLRGEPPALPPRGVSSSRSRDGSTNRNNGNKPPPPAVPPKRSSLTRSDLAIFSAENVSSSGLH
jgi:hypothetical protein